MATLRDVARAADVGVSTASRYLRGDGYVSPEAGARVQAAMDRLRYRPNAVARSLRDQRTMTLALVVPEIENPFYTTVSRGIEDVAYAAGYTVVFCNTDEQEQKQERYVHALLGRKIDGVLFVPCGEGGAGQCRLLEDADVPFVLVDREIAGIPADCVVGDNRLGSRQLIEHLLSLGHRRIGLIGGNPVDSVSRERRLGYEMALRGRSIAPEATLVCERDWSMESGWQLARQLLALERPPTALFCTNNVLAVGALRALHDLGRRVPDDTALVCFDDIEIAALLDPFLTVAVQPAYAMGKRAVTLLLDRLTGQRARAPVRAVLPVEIIVRRSCGGRPPSESAGLSLDGWIGRQWRTHEPAARSRGEPLGA